MRLAANFGEARGGQGVVANPNGYILGITALMILSVVANSRGFFNPLALTGE